MAVRPDINHVAFKSKTSQTPYYATSSKHAIPRRFPQPLPSPKPIRYRITFPKHLFNLLHFPFNILTLSKNSKSLSTCPTLST